MTPLVPAMPLARPRRPRADLTISFRGIGGCIFLALLWVWPFTVQPEAFQLAIPVATNVTIFALFFYIVWRWNRTLPVFEIGIFFGAVSLLYSVVTAVNFISAGLSWSALSDGRLLSYNLNAEDIARFTWPYTAIVAGFCAAYLLARGRAPLAHVPLIRPPKQVAVMVVLAFLSAEAYLVAFSFLTGAPLDPSYLGDGLEKFSVYYKMPFFLQQVTHNIYGVLFATKVCLLALLMQRWPRREFRYGIVIWLAIELLLSFARMGSRTYSALLLLIFFLLYHRMVRRLTMKLAVLGAALFISTFVVHGMIRTMGGSLHNALALDRRLWTTSNDFQTMFASAYDVQMRVSNGTLPKPPWQVFFIDFFLIIPSQFLPFEKIEPSAWYYSQLQAKVSAMFGFRAQGVIGFGWPDLFIRSAFLGLLFGLLHRWYMRHTAGFWATVGYGYAIIWSHYTYRSTMLWPVYFIVYEFFTVMIAVRLGALIITHVRGRSAAVEGAPA